MKGGEVYDRSVPRLVYDHLRTGFIVHEAHDTLNYLIEHGYREGGPVPLGRSLGDVLAWMWTASPDEVGLFMADFMGQLRHHDALVGEGCPRVRFEDVLRSLPAAMPNGFAGTAELIEQPRLDVPGFLGSDDLNS